MRSWLSTFRKPEVPPIADLARRIVHASIAPLQTEHVVIRLGMQLPPDDQFKIRGRLVGKPPEPLELVNCWS